MSLLTSQAVKKTVLYLPSTPLNILVCAAHAYQFREQQNAVMVIIDQQKVDNHPYLNSLQQWQASPFKDVRVLPGKAKGFKKLQQSRQNFLEINRLVQHFQFDIIATGSDRRVEFQYAMYKAMEFMPVTGWYMDDGLYSYAGRASSYWKDSINAMLKKIIYGLWWKEPKTVGASSWIEEVFLFSPCHAHVLLKSKHVTPIESGWFQNSAIKELTQQVFGQHGLAENDLTALKKADLCILIPHPNNIKKMEGYAERLHHLLNWAESAQLKTVIKYHPRTNGEDALGLKTQFSIDIIPAEIAFEFVLTQFSSQIQIIGDVGTALLTAKWLRPDIKSMALLSYTNAIEEKMSALLRLHGVLVKDSIENLQKELGV